MDMDSNLSEYLNNFYGIILKAEANLQYIAHVATRIDDISSRKSFDMLQANTWRHDFTSAMKTIEKLRIILRNFNDDVDIVFENFAATPSTAYSVDVETTLATSVSMILSHSESESDAESLPPAPSNYSLPSLPPSISHRIENVYSFTSDVCNYRCGVFGTCEITHIIDSVECICCMVDFERNVSSELFEQWLSKSIPLDGFPVPNEIFGIEINSQIVRATCERQLIEGIDKTAVPLLLIDIGKVIHVKSLSDHKIYNLTQEAKLTPIRTNLCKIEKIGSKYTNDMSLDESSIMKRTFIFKVTKVCDAKRMLTVELFLTNPFVEEFNDVLTEDQQQKQLHHLSLSTTGNENALTQNERMESADIESALRSSSNGNYDNDITNTSFVTKIPRRRSMHEQPQQQQQQQQQQKEQKRKTLDAKVESMIENTISNANCNAGNTKRSNATVNDEYNQRNDDIACALEWYCNDNDNDHDDDGNELAAGNTTNPTENGALIRASQRNFSQNKKQRKTCIDNNNNNTDDTHKLFAKSNDLVAGAGAVAGACAIVIADNNNNNHNANRDECSSLLPLEMPQTMIQYVNTHILRNGNVGETITIFPTCIVSVEQFYARLGEHYHSFKNFHVKLNAELQTNKLVRCSLIPDSMEMVLVLLRDGTLHRAKVLNNSPTAQNRIEVFCLDSGLTRFASLDNIFHWSPLCCLIPFQAVLCNVVNIRSRRENDAEAIEFMSKALLHRPVLAEVKELNTCGMMVRILYDDGFDIVDDLLTRNLATRPRIDHKNGNGKTKSLNTYI